MASYVIRPNAFIDKDATIQGTSNSGSTWATATDANVATYAGDNSDTTGIRSSNSASRWFQLALGAPSIASDEFICRVGGLVRWSGGKNGEYVGCAPYLLSDGVPGGVGAISTDGRGTPLTSEPSYMSQAFTTAQVSAMGIAAFMDGDATAAVRPVIWELGATIYTLKRATATPQNTTMSTSTYPTIPVDTTATIDWEASTYNWQLLRKITVEVRVESGGTGVGTGTLVTTATKDQYFSATGTLTVSVTMPDSLANGTYKIYARAIRHREGETSVATDQIGNWSSAATLTMSMTPPASPTLAVSADDNNDRVQMTVTPNASGSYTSPYITIERSPDGGITWQSVRAATAIAGAFGSPSVFYDYEAPRRATVLYRARVSAYTSGVLNTSAPTTTQSAFLSSTTWNLKCPQAPNLNMIGATVVNVPTEKMDEDLGVFRPFGRRYPVVVSGSITGWDGELTFVTSTAIEWTQLKALIEVGAVLYLESGFGWSKYIRFVGGAKAEIMGTATSPRRRVTASYVETAIPADTFLVLPSEVTVTIDGGAAPTTTWDATYDGGNASTATFADILDGGSAR